MMKKTAISCTTIALLSSVPLQAAPKKPDAKPNAQSQQNEGNRQSNRSQGAFHAAVNAIQNVCSKDLPAARRSALCTPKPVSPH